MYRLGFTESTLLFYYYLEKYHPHIDRTIYYKNQYELFRWLHSTSGYYDKHIITTHPNAILHSPIDYEGILKSPVYNSYFSQVLDSIQSYNQHVQLNLTDYMNKQLIQYIPDFFRYMNKECKYNIQRDDTNYISRNYIYNFIKDRHTVIINNLGSLMIKQYKNGNLKNIYDDVPSVQSLDYIEPQYTFFNKGPYNSILDSVKDIYAKIDSKIKAQPVDCFIISSGAYSMLIADYITKTYNKHVVLIGGDLPTYFGILTKRGATFDTELIENKKQYFITVPDNMKPSGYQFVEGGCYW